MAPHLHVSNIGAYIHAGHGWENAQEGHHTTVVAGFKGS